MTNFISIKDALEAKKGDFVGIVSNIGPLKAGTNDKGDWTMKLLTIEDASSKLQMAVFNEDIDKFKLGGQYEFENLWWKYKDNKLSLALGQYAKIKMVTPAPEDKNQTTMETSVPEPVIGKQLLQIMEAYGKENIDDVGMKEGKENEIHNSFSILHGSIAMDAIKFTLKFLDEPK